MFFYRHSISFLLALILSLFSVVALATPEYSALHQVVSSADYNDIVALNVSNEFYDHTAHFLKSNADLQLNGADGLSEPDKRYQDYAVFDNRFKNVNSLVGAVGFSLKPY